MAITLIHTLAKLPLIPTLLGQWLSTALQSPLVTYFVLPLLVAVTSVSLRKFARPGNARHPEDMLVGFDLGVVACVTLLVSSFVLVRKFTSDPANNPIDAQNYLTGIFVALVLCVAGLAVIAQRMSERGWATKKDSAEKEPKKAWLIAVNVMGFLLLAFAFYLSGESSP